MMFTVSSGIYAFFGQVLLNPFKKWSAMISVRYDRELTVVNFCHIPVNNGRKKFFNTFSFGFSTFQKTFFNIQCLLGYNLF